MKPTHCATLGNKQDVTAWQFSHTAPIPVWVARKFHQVSDKKGWTAIDLYGKVIEANEGDWVVAPNVGTCFVLTDKEFNECFKPLIP